MAMALPLVIADLRDRRGRAGFTAEGRARTSSRRHRHRAPAPGRAPRAARPALTAGFGLTTPGTAPES